MEIVWLKLSFRFVRWNGRMAEMINTLCAAVHFNILPNGKWGWQHFIDRINSFLFSFVDDASHINGIQMGFHSTVAFILKFRKLNAPAKKRFYLENTKRYTHFHGKLKYWNLVGVASLSLVFGPSSLSFISQSWEWMQTKRKKIKIVRSFCFPSAPSLFLSHSQLSNRSHTLDLLWLRFWLPYDLSL